MTELQAPTLATFPVLTRTGKLTPEQTLSARSSFTSAALWRLTPLTAPEIYAPASNSHYILSFIQSAAPHETFHDGRLVGRGRLRRGDVNVVPLHVAPRAVLPEGIDLLHIYLPTIAVQTCAADCGFDPNHVEIIDPANQQDRSLNVASEAVLSELQSGDAFSALRLDVLAQDFSLLLLRRWSNVADRQPRSSRRVPSLAPWQIKRITAKLREDIDRDTSLAELAELVRLSETYLCTAFRNATGLPPHQWQKKQRIERAKELLASSEASITEIALEVGYSNPGHFATMFRTATGLTPRAWRRERTR